MPYSLIPKELLHQKGLTKKFVLERHKVTTKKLSPLINLGLQIVLISNNIDVRNWFGTKKHKGGKVI